ncbi:tyrosine-type recombinase/integrase [Vibrio breoganii]|uniref:tyrosine-type recombinase/integrase n=1 Tax=Vibrio breoganii TaxID=553239 RepID=UPI000C8214B5|nr:site-specific integrase [Vibrio breoganii]PMG98922.1 hypothetical protein BCU80_03200 [Vibrio breoganii]PMK34082.1 hypothetical protein BCU06_00365 [Vibrio breoganii]PML54573.1 hypothetical protein BCT73_15490 [Vibrio breoganii]PMO81355.1 hypothetical protein BCT00_11700 [Vibrio breoganii]
MALTDSKLKSLNGKKHDSSPIKIADRDGLSVYHRKTGKLSFVFRYRYNGKPQDLALGVYPIVTLSEAREEAIKCKKLLSDGQDPKLERQLKKMKVLEAVTVQDALEHWLTVDASKSRANFEKHRAQFKKHIYPFIGSIPLDKCETRHWTSTLRNIRDGVHHRPAPSAAGYILSNCKRALEFCREDGFAYSYALKDVKVRTIGEYQAKKDRVLTWVEMLDVWNWTQQETSNWYYANLTKLLMVFGCRSQELRLSKVSEWDLDSMVWTVPTENNKIRKKVQNKAGGEIRRPIPEELKDYIQSLIDQSKNEYLLGELKSPEAVSTFGRSLPGKLKHDAWTLHDIRRSFSTYLNELDIPPHIVEAMLGHEVSGIAGIYNKASYDTQKLTALNLWLSKLNETESQTNVVGIR